MGDVDIYFNLVRWKKHKIKCNNAGWNFENQTNQIVMTKQTWPQTPQVQNILRACRRQAQAFTHLRYCVNNGQKYRTKNSACKGQVIFLLKKESKSIELPRSDDLGRRRKPYKILDAPWFTSYICYQSNLAKQTTQRYYGKNVEGNRYR